MNREELKSIFDALRNDPQHHLGLGDIRLTIAQQDAILDLFPFKDNPLLPAEGAEEILDDIAARIDSSVLSDNRDMIKEFYRNKLNTLATLHAQRIANKMVSERLRGKYVFTYEELRKVCCDFFRSWWNTPGSNTYQGFDAWALKTGLKK